MKTFKVCIIPFSIAWGNKDSNLCGMASELNQVEKDTDLVVIPELFSTDFISDKKSWKNWRKETTAIPWMR